MNQIIMTATATPVVYANRPAPGEQLIVTVMAGGRIRIDFTDENEAEISEQGDDLLIEFPDGGSILLQGFVSTSLGDNPPSIVLEDGTVLIGDVILADLRGVKLQDLDADGAMPEPGGGASEYSEYSDGLIDGLTSTSDVTDEDFSLEMLTPLDETRIDPAELVEYVDPIIPVEDNPVKDETPDDETPDDETPDVHDPVDDLPLAPILSVADALGAAPLGSEHRVNSVTENDQRYPSIAAMPDGGYVVTWMTYTPPEGYQEDWGWIGWQIHGQRFDADDNPVGDEFQVSTNIPHNIDYWTPEIAPLEDGGFIIVWDGKMSEYELDENGNFVLDANGNVIPSIYHRHHPDNPDVENTDVEIFAQRFNSEGEKVGGQDIVNLTTANRQVFPDVTGLADGGYVIVWISRRGDPNGDSFDLYGRRFDADGNPVECYDADGNLVYEFRINSFVDGLQGGNDVDNGFVVQAFENGGFLFIWRSQGQDDLADNNGWGIYGQLYDADGQRDGDEFRVNSTVEGNQNYPIVTILDDGGFLVVWVGDGENGSFGIFAQRYNANGEEVHRDGTTSGHDEFQVDTDATAFVMYVDVLGEVTALDGGGFVVVWVSGGSLQAQIFDSAGIKVGGEFQINSPWAVNNVGAPDVVALEGGGFTVVWQDGNAWGAKDGDSPGRDGDGLGIFARQFDAEGNPVVHNDIELAIAASLQPSDDSTLSIVISGVPDGFSLTSENGTLTDNGDGTWTLDAAALEGLTLHYPDDYSGKLALTVVATATNDDGLTASTDTDLTIVVAPTGIADYGVIQEDVNHETSGNLLDNDNGIGLTLVGVASGHVDSLDPTDFEIGGIITEWGILTWNADGSYTYTIDDDNPAFKLMEDGDQVQDSFSYLMRDADGGYSWTTLAIIINGSSPPIVIPPIVIPPIVIPPTAIADYGVIHEGINHETTGNLLDNDIGIGLTLVGVASGYVDSLDPTDFEIGGVITEWGILTWNADGSYTYTVDASNPEFKLMKNGDQEQDSFSYLLQNADGGYSWTTLTITIKGSSPTIEVTTEWTENGDDVLLTVDETNLGVDATQDFSAFFSHDYGNSGAGSIVYSLHLWNNGNLVTGLNHTASGERVLINYNGDTIEGRTETSGELVFTLTIDEDTGIVTLDQLQALWHREPTDPDETTTLQRDVYIVLRATITDDNGNVETANIKIGQNLVFKDDGPTASLNSSFEASLTVNETDLNSPVEFDYADAFNTDHGADGEGSVTYKLAFLPPGSTDSSVINSNLFTYVTGQVIKLKLLAGSIVGFDLDTRGHIFEISVDAKTGVVSLTLFHTIQHDGVDALLLDAGLIGLKVIVSDGDGNRYYGDSVEQLLDIGQDLEFKDGGTMFSGVGSRTMPEDHNVVAGDVNYIDDGFTPDLWTAGAYVGIYGNLNFNSDGTWRYFLDKALVDGLYDGKSVTDTFTVLTAHGPSHDISVTITGSNDDAVITGTTTGSITEDAAPNTVSGNLDHTDVDKNNGNDLWTAVNTAIDSDYGSWVIDAAGVWIYTLDNSHAAVVNLNDGETLTDTFTVFTGDGTDQVVTITINGASDQPIINYDSSNHKALYDFNLPFLSSWAQTTLSPVITSVSVFKSNEEFRANGINVKVIDDSFKFQWVDADDDNLYESATNTYREYWSKSDVLYLSREMVFVFEVTDENSATFAFAFANAVEGRVVFNPDILSHTTVDYGHRNDIQWLTIGDFIDNNNSSKDYYLYGSDADETLKGSLGEDIIYGYDGDDSLIGRDGHDTLIGGDGADTILGGSNNDRIEGGAGDDSLLGDRGSDILLGGDGDDTLNGSQHSDTLIGESGSDTLISGGGQDKYVMTHVEPTDFDTLTDYTNQSDVIDLSELIDDSTNIDSSNFGDYVDYNFNTGTLKVDTDGLGTDADWVKIAEVNFNSSPARELDLLIDGIHFDQDGNVIV